MCITKIRSPGVTLLPDNFDVNSSFVNAGGEEPFWVAGNESHCNYERVSENFRLQPANLEYGGNKAANLVNHTVRNGSVNLSHIQQGFASTEYHENYTSMYSSSSNDVITESTSEYSEELEDSIYLVESKPTNTSSIKKCPKRRRKRIQKPGVTAKNQPRHFVHHNYHDHANDAESDHVLVKKLSDNGSTTLKKKGGVAVPFPFKLHQVLDEIKNDGFGDVISWQPHGRAFRIHDMKKFTTSIMEKYFNHKKLTSFQRQLNLYGFEKLTFGRDDGAYYHELFLYGKDFLCHSMTRTRIKGTRYKAASCPELEPNFYEMPYVPMGNVEVTDSLNFTDERLPIQSTINQEPLSVGMFETTNYGHIETFNLNDASVGSNFYRNVSMPVHANQVNVPNFRDGQQSLQDNLCNGGLSNDMAGGNSSNFFPEQRFVPVPFKPDLQNTQPTKSEDMNGLGFGGIGYHCDYNKGRSEGSTDVDSGSNSAGSGDYGVYDDVDDLMEMYLPSISFMDGAFSRECV